MIVAEAVQLISPAIRPVGGAWADFGAGAGLFTRALASLLGPKGTVYAVDSDSGAISALRSLQAGQNNRARITPIEADFRELSSFSALVRAPLDGALFANALHFVPDAGGVLSDVRALLGDGGRIVIVEYDGRPANRWVPYPIPRAKLHEIATALFGRAPSIIGERPSDYGGIMYCAELEAR